MRAVVQDRYGSPDQLRVETVDQPAARDDEVLVRVRAASVHPDVWHVVTGRPYALRLFGAGMRRPKQPIPGTDLAGTVESVGRSVTRFRPGDEVFGESLRGQQWRNGGAYAEFAVAPQDALAHKPGNVSFEQAATVPTAGIITLRNLPPGDELGPGRRVLVNGAAGGVGALAVQIAKAHGAEVTGVDSTGKLALIRSLGADHTIDYTREDFTQGRQRYDLIFDIPGNHPFSKARRVLTPGGTYVLIGHDGYGRTRGRWLGSIPRVLGLVARSPFVRQLPKPRAMLSKPDAMAVLQELLATGQITPVVDRHFPLDRAPAAIRYLASGEACGRVVITP